MDGQKSPQDLCTEIGGEVREMAQWLSSGQLTSEQFRVALLALEQEKVRRFGFLLTGDRGPDGRTHFELRFKESNALCATLDFDSGTHQLTVRNLCG